MCNINGYQKFKFQFKYYYSKIISTNYSELEAVAALNFILNKLENTLLMKSTGYYNRNLIIVVLVLRKFYSIIFNISSSYNRNVSKRPTKT